MKYMFLEAEVEWLQVVLYVWILWEKRNSQKKQAWLPETIYQPVCDIIAANVLSKT